MSDFVAAILTFLSGGALGAIITIIYNKWKDRMQVMKCVYFKNEQTSKMPGKTKDGEPYQTTSHTHCVLKNTTNADQKDFSALFKFGPHVRILSVTDITKVGVDRLKKRIVNRNECVVRVKNFNRKDRIHLIFEIANVGGDPMDTNEYDADRGPVSVVEDDCIGFRIKLVSKLTARRK